MDKAARLQELAQAWRACTACRLHQYRRQVVFWQGNPDAKLAVVGEGPGTHEDQQGIPWCWTAGNLLFQLLAHSSPRPEVLKCQEEYQAAGKNRDQEFMDRKARETRELVLRDVFVANAVMCLPKDLNPPPGYRGVKVREPENDEIKSCRPALFEALYVVDPAVILAAGGTALHALSGKDQPITRARGVFQDILIPGRTRSVSYLVMPTFHPSYILRVNDFEMEGGEAKKAFKDIEQAQLHAFRARSHHA